MSQENATHEAAAGEQHPAQGSRFRGKVAVVTGASRGIGFAIAKRLVSEGARVAITARGAEALEAAVTELGGPDHAIGVPGKADDPDHQDETLARVAEAFGPLDYLVNNTGINPVVSSLLDIDLPAARKIAEVNALAALSWTQKAHRASLQQRGGAVVFLSSFAAQKYAPGIDFYGVSKAMLDRMITALAVEMAPNCRVNGVAPAVVRTRFAQALIDAAGEDASAYPLRRFGRPEDVAGPVAFLLSDDAAWITGTVLPIDGGLGAVGGLL